MSKANAVVCTREGLWPWAVLNVALILGTFIWLLFNYQKTNFFQEAAQEAQDAANSEAAANGSANTNPNAKNANAAPNPNVPNSVNPAIPLNPSIPTTAANPNLVQPLLQGTPVAFPIYKPLPTSPVISLSQILQNIAPSIVTITTEGAMAQSGSGVIVHNQGYIITNHHVVENARKIIVSVGPDQASRNYPAELVDFSEDWDLAVLRITSAGNTVFSPAPLGNSDSILVGDNILVVGSPYGLGQTVSSGIISNANRTLSTANREFKGLIQTDAPLNAGSSGGAMVNTTGEVIGINTAMISTTQSFSGVGFAIPVNVLWDVFPEYIEKVSNNAGLNLVGMPLPPNTPIRTAPGHTQVREETWLGVDAASVDSNVIKQLELPFSHGVIITRVYEKSVSWKAGLRPEDVVYRVNGQLVKDEEMLWSLLRNADLDENVQFTLFRRGLPKFYISLKLEPKTI
ncbi:MAG: trypsin-like peptidase domain-containing protein [Candidatus Riflebacteria bacterium]|nr:trypsin-like peptidase domain-containing protein [Candidatus Riflebacteria bacterium]